MNITTYVDFVKRQVEIHERKLSQNGQFSRDSKRNKWLHEQFSGLLQAMEDDIQNCANPTSRVELGGDVNQTFSPQPADLDSLLSSPTQLQPGQLEGLPSELLDQLQISEVEKFQWMVVDIINRTPEKTISLEVLLIALYHKTKKVFERTDLSNRIYRMAKKGLLFSVSGKKGWYSTVKQDAQTNSDLGPDEDSDTQDYDLLK